MLRYLLFAVAVLLLSGFGIGSRAQTFSSVVTFGDSLSDSGNIVQSYAPVAKSRGFNIPDGTSFTTNPDPVWAEIVAEAFGASAVNSLAGGTNYS